MTTNPFYNASLAILYIVTVVSTIFYTAQIFGDEESILFPIGGLSLFVLSAAVMAYLFFYRPVLLLLDGEREKGVKLFLHTLGIFACVTGVLFFTCLFIAFR